MTRCVDYKVYKSLNKRHALTLLHKLCLFFLSCLFQHYFLSHLIKHFFLLSALFLSYTSLLSKWIDPLTCSRWAGRLVLAIVFNYNKRNKMHWAHVTAWWRWKEHDFQSGNEHRIGFLAVLCSVMTLLWDCGHVNKHNYKQQHLHDKCVIHRLLPMRSHAEWDFQFHLL